MSSSRLSETVQLHEEKRFGEVRLRSSVLLNQEGTEVIERDWRVTFTAAGADVEPVILCDCVVGAGGGEPMTAKQAEDTSTAVYHAAEKLLRVFVMSRRTKTKTGEKS